MRVLFQIQGKMFKTLSRALQASVRGVHAARLLDGALLSSCDRAGSFLTINVVETGSRTVTDAARRSSAAQQASLGRGVLSPWFHTLTFDKSRFDWSVKLHVKDDTFKKPQFSNFCIWNLSAVCRKGYCTLVHPLPIIKSTYQERVSLWDFFMNFFLWDQEILLNMNNLEFPFIFTYF